MGARFLHGRDSDLMIWEDSGAVSMSGFSGSTPHPNQRRLHASNVPSQGLRASVRRGAKPEGSRAWPQILVSVRAAQQPDVESHLSANRLRPRLRPRI